MTRGAIAAPHRLASEAGAAVLRAGGNAVDAAVAADAVLCVVYPHMTSVGGDLFAMVWPAGESHPVGRAGAGRSGSLATASAVRDQGHDRMPPDGVLTVTVPGTADAWGRLVERFGSMGMRPLLEPAAGLARDGFPVAPGLAEALAENAERLMRDPECRRLLPPLKAGMTMRNPELAGTLSDLGRNGFNSFYRGDLAAAIVAAVERRGGFLTAADMAVHRGEWAAPLAVAFRDLTVYEMPPPTQGLAALGMLVRLSRIPPERLSPGPGFVQELRRVRDAVYPLRDRYISDPDFASVPLQPFLDPDVDGGGRGEPLPAGDTICVCAADEHGNLVSIVQSVANAFGSGVIAEGTGILLQNRGCYFSLEEGHVNLIEPRKRTMHTLIPALAARRERPHLAFGTMGADAQPQIQVQVLLGLTDSGLDPQSAVSAPRVRVDPGGGTLLVEADYPQAALIQRHDPSVRLAPPRSSSLGHAQAVQVMADGSWRAGSDVRADGSVEIV